MKEEENGFSVRSKVWIVDAVGEVVFGPGRLKILEAVKNTGSIKKASKELNMSYRGVWGRIKATEERLGKPLLVRNIGGKAGGGSELTPFALELMERFKMLHRDVADESDRLFDKIVGPLEGE
ncbi:MAG: LysR family transcriptional regulator [Desulfarculaceae bacterium]|nr:LysR family transcriptional regulator [Desulfarculaceae bacterium]